MSARGKAVATAAEGLIGTRFRFHGRHPAIGLDCLGLVTVALGAAGCKVFPAAGYRMKRRDIGDMLHLARRAGLEDAEGAIEPGDIVLACPGPAQFHLLVADSGGGFVHAHAGLRRVVRAGAPLPWPILRQWRLAPNG